MNGLSSSTQKFLISIRLFFIAALILVLAGATAIKKPSHASPSDSYLSEISVLTDLNSFSSTSSFLDGTSLARKDNPEVPITSAPDDDQSENSSEKTAETSNSSQNTDNSSAENSKDSSPAATPNTSQKANSSPSYNTYTTYIYNTNSSSQTPSQPAPSAPANSSTNYDPFYDDSGSPYNGGAYIDDNGNFDSDDSSTSSSQTDI